MFGKYSGFQKRKHEKGNIFKKLSSLTRYTLVKGTLVLTATGFATRLMGFFYRVFLSHTFGEEGVGLYQLIFPVYALCFSLTSAGIQSALARCVAKETAFSHYGKARKMLYTSLWITIAVSCIVMIALQQNAVYLAEHFLREPRCAGYLVILSYSFPFASVHSCICGYYLGLKSTKIPAFSQLAEQIVRILGVLLLYQFGLRNGVRFGISIAVVGLILGEIASSLYCIASFHRFKNPVRLPGPSLSCSKELLALSIPLTASRILLNLLQSVEAVSIPQKLRVYGLAHADALAAYGILTGMALPCILFPSAISNSLATMLLPAVAKAQAEDRKSVLLNLIRKSILSCICLGVCFFCFLFLSGEWIGKFLFHSETAGTYIVVLSWICPFLYVNSACISIINGIGKTTTSFLINLFSLGIRICSVWFLIPLYGMYGYFIGLLASQICMFFCSFTFLNRQVS